jgi:hypothetical protein
MQVSGESPSLTFACCARASGRKKANDNVSSHENRLGKDALTSGNKRFERRFFVAF